MLPRKSGHGGKRLPQALRRFFHLAWQGTTGEARNDAYLQNENVRYALDAVSAAKRFGCKVFVGAGSQAEYGRAQQPLAADTPAFPENGYGIAKLCAGQLTRLLANRLGMRQVWARILSVYGPYDGENSMVMSAITALLEGRIPKFTAGSSCGIICIARTPPGLYCSWRREDGTAAFILSAAGKRGP
ncbi:MAG: NAD-dependent epimerase/dehydratase family protein [Christensenellaceae bacterium]